MIQEALEKLTGAVPPGLEFLEYIFAVLFVVIGLHLVCDLLRNFFRLFIK